MGEGQIKKSAQELSKKTPLAHIAHGVLRYILLSIFISLFLENTLFWMALATAAACLDYVAYRHAWEGTAAAQTLAQMEEV